MVSTTKIPVPFIHIRVPKNASMSIDNALSDYKADFSINKADRDPSIAKHFTWEHCRLYLQKKFLNIQDYYCFAFIRNPWQRMVSHYLGKKDWLGIGFLDWLHLINQKSITNYVSKIKNLGRYPMKTQQIQFLTENHSINPEDIKVNIFRFDNLEEEIGRLSDVLQLPISLSHINKTPDYHYREWYNDESKEFVADLFKDDIRYWKFTF